MKLFKVLIKVFHNIYIVLLFLLVIVSGLLQITGFIISIFILFILYIILLLLYSDRTLTKHFKTEADKVAFATLFYYIYFVSYYVLFM